MAEVLRNFRFGNTTWASPPETITLSRDNLALFTADDRNGTSEEPAALTSAWLGGQLRIPLYSVIFVLAVVGNSLVIVTLAQNRRMRTVTNVFLLNLSVSDLLLAVFCMPFTLIPTLLKDFIFGKVVCVFIRYLQGVSVGVSVLTLVAISLERYYAICHPLTSRRWQTRSHAYRIIAAVWVLALSVMIPTAVYQKLPKLRSGAHKCMEIWDDLTLEKAYAIFLDLVLLVVPLMLMLIAYGWITFTLWRGIQLEIRHAQGMILKPAKFVTKGANPIGAVMISWFLVQLVLLIGSLNAIAPVTSSFFLLSYASTNLACLALDLASAPNFRPTFKYFSSHTSFLGLLGCMVMCFIINAIYSSVALVVCMLLVITLHLRVYPESWGSISQALIFHQVRKYLLLLDSRKDHVKYWRPQMLLLVNNPRSCGVLIDFINDIKKGGLYVIGHVKIGSFDDMSIDPCQVDMPNWMQLVDQLKVKAFVELTLADSVRDGMNHLVRVSGLGGMKPNTICLGFYDGTQPDDLLSVQLDRKQRRTFQRFQNSPLADDVTSRFPEPRDGSVGKPLSVNEYVHMIADILKMNRNVCLFRYFDQLDKQAIFNGKYPRYIDVWPVNFFQPHTSHYFDNTCLFLLQLACILHMVPGWKSHTILRVFLCVDTETSDAMRIESKLHQILTDLRILGQVKIVTWEHVTRLIGGDATETARDTALPREYLVALNELVMTESRNTAMVFSYLPMVPASESAWDTYLEQLNIVTANLPPTVLVHAVYTVVSTTL